MDELPKSPLPGVPVEFPWARPGDLVLPRGATTWWRLIEVRHDPRFGTWLAVIEQPDRSPSPDRMTCALHEPGCLVWRPFSPTTEPPAPCQPEPPTPRTIRDREHPSPEDRLLRSRTGVEPRIWYVCPDVEPPVGGVQVIYRHVGELTRSGYRAAVVHERPGFRYPWAPSETPALSRGEVEPDPAHDVVVWPEVYGPAIGTWGPGCRRVILNQNAFYTFGSCNFFDPQPLPYQDARTIAVVTVSEHNRRWLEYAFPGLRVRRITVAIDDRLFTPSSQKVTRICYMPRKGADGANQVLHILRQRGALEGVEVAPIDGRPSAEVAAIMRESLIFLALSPQEGFGLPAAEAMASGCIVVGYDGGGGAEFMRRGLAYPVPVGDVIAVAARVEQVLAEWPRRPDRVLAMGQRASRFVRERYSLQRERDDVLGLWHQLLTSPSWTGSS